MKIIRHGVMVSAAAADTHAVILVINDALMRDVIVLQKNLSVVNYAENDLTFKRGIEKKKAQYFLWLSSCFWLPDVVTNSKTKEITACSPI